MWPSFRERNAWLETPGPPIRNCPQQPKDIFAGRTAKCAVTSMCSSRGTGAVAVAAAGKANAMVAKISNSILRTEPPLLVEHPTLPVSQEVSNPRDRCVRWFTDEAVSVAAAYDVGQGYPSWMIDLMSPRRLRRTETSAERKRSRRLPRLRSIQIMPARSAQVCSGRT